MSNISFIFILVLVFILFSYRAYFRRTRSTHF